MGWANCGEDKRGRPIGYAHEGTCDETDCAAKIDRGLSYACGGMHGEDEISCGRYFCPEHLNCIELKPEHRSAGHHGCYAVCRECEAVLKAEGYLVDDGAPA